MFPPPPPVLPLPSPQQGDQDSYQEGESDDASSTSSRDMSLCQPAVTKLVEYIQMNFVEGDSPLPLTPTLPPLQERLDSVVRAVCLTKGPGDGAEFGLTFGNIPIFGDPEGKRRRMRRGRRGDRGPLLDVGCIWVTEVRKGSPAARCGKLKLRDELLSLNGQLMVGVDVTGAR